jgi:hypothetical protein
MPKSWLCGNTASEEKGGRRVTCMVGAVQVVNPVQWTHSLRKRLVFQTLILLKREKLPGYSTSLCFPNLQLVSLQHGGGSTDPLIGGGLTKVGPCAS